VHIINIHT